jgi:putative acetyltransferase
MIKIIKTDSDNQDFVSLVQQLDANLNARYKEIQAFYDQFNTIDKIKHVIVAYENDTPVGCGAMKEFNPDAMEIKRMFTLPESRGKGIATQILIELEAWAAELFYKKCVLETGKKQVEAIGLYQKNGYQKIPNYGQYVGVVNSLCFKKDLRS